MPTWWGGVDQVIDRGFGGSRHGAKLRGIAPHHVAGRDGRDYVANANPRNSHPTYHLGDRYGATGIVHPNRRPYSTGGAIDAMMATIEIDNSATGHPWPVSDRSIEAVIEIAVHHAREGGYTRMEANRVGEDQGDVFFIAWHSQYVNTECPGPYLRDRIPRIVAEGTRRLQGARPTPPLIPTPTPEDDMAYLRIQGKTGARHGGAYLTLPDKSTIHLGAAEDPRFASVPLITDEAAIQKLYTTFSGMK